VSVGGKKTPLELVLLDDESDATKTVARLESLADQNVAGYLGASASDLHAAPPPSREEQDPILRRALRCTRCTSKAFATCFSPF